MLFRTLPALLVLILAIPALAETKEPAPEPTLPAITVSSIESLVVRDRVMASGLVGAVERISVQPRIEGQAIEEIRVEVGDYVEPGEVLAVLSDTALTLQKSQLIASRASARASIAQAEAQLVEAESAASEAERVRERTAKLLQQGTASQALAEQVEAQATSSAARVTVAKQGLEAARAQLELVEAQIADVDLNLSRTQVQAIVAGEVVERNAAIGAIASAAGQPMFVLIRGGELELRADVAEQDVLRLAAGQTAALKLVGLAEPLTGTVHLVEPTVDVTTRLGRVRITIDTPEKVRSGMFAEAEILVTERETLVAPVTGVGSGPEGTSVLRVTDGVVARVPVTTGIRDGGLVEIREGLSAGDVIVTRAGAFVRDGDRINPVPADTTLASN